MNTPEALRNTIVTRLTQIIDPETGVDIIRMHLIEGITVGTALLHELDEEHGYTER